MRQRPPPPPRLPQAQRRCPRRASAMAYTLGSACAPPTPSHYGRGGPHLCDASSQLRRRLLVRVEPHVALHRGVVVAVARDQVLQHLPLARRHLRRRRQAASSGRPGRDAACGVARASLPAGRSGPKEPPRPPAGGAPRLAAAGRGGSEADARGGTGASARSPVGSAVGPLSRGLKPRMLPRTAPIWLASASRPRSL